MGRKDFNVRSRGARSSGINAGDYADMMQYADDAWQDAGDASEEEQNLVQGRKAATAADLLSRASKLLTSSSLGGEDSRPLRLVALDKALPSDYLHRWHIWEGGCFLPKCWNKAPDTFRSRLLSPEPADRVYVHMRRLGERVQRTPSEVRASWRGALLWCLVVLRERQSLPTNMQPVVVLDDGSTCFARELCLDIGCDLGVGTARVRSVPAYLKGMHSFLVKLGASTASEGAPELSISEDNPFLGPEMATSLLAGAVNDPTFADIVFHFTSEAFAADADTASVSAAARSSESGRYDPCALEDNFVLGNETCAFGHRLVLGRASEVFRSMVSGPLAKSAAREDGRLHIMLPNFVEHGPFLFLLSYLYTGETDDLANISGVPLMPPSFGSAELVCSVLQLADHFLLNHLKQWCEVYLSQPELLSVESVIDILTHADACNAARLFQVCAHQIWLLHDTVSQTERWSALPEDLQRRVTSEFRTTTRRGSR